MTLMCNDCAAAIRDGNYIAWSGKIWHFHCLLHRFSCISLKRVITGMNAAQANIETMAPDDRERIRKFADLCQRIANDLIMAQEARIHIHDNNLEQIPKTDAFAYMRNLAKIERNKQYRLLQDYLSAGRIAECSDSIDEVLAVSCWIYSRGMPATDFDRGI